MSALSAMKSSGCIGLDLEPCVLDSTSAADIIKHWQPKLRKHRPFKKLMFGGSKWMDQFLYHQFLDPRTSIFWTAGVFSTWATSVLWYQQQRWSRGHKALGQGQGHKKISRPKTDPLEAKAKDTCASVLQKKGLKNFFSSDLKKRSSKIFFQAISTWRKQKKVFKNFLRGFWRFPAKFQWFKK